MGRDEEFPEMGAEWKWASSVLSLVCSVCSFPYPICFQFQKKVFCRLRIDQLSSISITLKLRPQII